MRVLFAATLAAMLALSSTAAIAQDVQLQGVLARAIEEKPPGCRMLRTEFGVSAVCESRAAALAAKAQLAEAIQNRARLFGPLCSTPLDPPGPEVCEIQVET